MFKNMQFFQLQKILLPKGTFTGRQCIASLLILQFFFCAMSTFSFPTGGPPLHHGHSKYNTFFSFRNKHRYQRPVTDAFSITDTNTRSSTWTFKSRERIRYVNIIIHNSHIPNRQIEDTALGTGAGVGADIGADVGVGASTVPTKLFKIQDITTISKHVLLCFITSLMLAFYEGYDCSFLKPESATIRQFPPSDERIIREQDVHVNSNIIQDIIQDIIQQMNYGTRGMGRGEVDRKDGWFQATYFGINEDEYNNINNNNNNNHMEAITTTSTETGNDDKTSNINSLRNIQSYNEIMKHHRESRVLRWKKDAQKFVGTNQNILTKNAIFDYNKYGNNVNVNTFATNNNEDLNILNIKQSVRIIYEIITNLQLLKSVSTEYDWDAMKMILESDLFRYDLELSCNVLRSSVGYIDYDSRQEIGFDWGSCAWRHCGAQADAQEALAELYNSIGLFEPFECLFTIDIIERSMRDILNVVPMKYHLEEDVKQLSHYEPYRSQQDLNSENGDDIGIDSSDMDYLRIMSGLRNDYSFDSS